MGMQRSSDAVIITLLLGAHRPLADKKAVAAAINKLVVEALHISPDDVFIALIPVPNESFSFGRGELQLHLVGELPIPRHAFDVLSAPRSG